MLRGKQRDLSNMHCGEDLSFFSSLEDWRRTVLARHPDAKVEVNADGVYRAYLGELKMAAFNQTLGHGYVAGKNVADYLGAHPHRDSNRKVSLAMFRGVVVRSARKGGVYVA